MSNNGKWVNVEELRQRLTALKEEKKRLDSEARELAKKRDEIDSRIKILRADALEIKRVRDEANAEVKRLKEQKKEIKTERARKIEEIKKIQAEIKSLAAKKPKKEASVLQREIEAVEWKIQTTPLSLREEKQLVEKVKHLETQLNIHRRIEQLNQRKLELTAELRALEARAKKLHEKMISEVEKSRKTHEEMLKRLEEARNLKKEAENVHRLFLQAMDRAKPVKEKIKKIAEKIALMEAEERRESEENLLENIAKQALEKLKRGEKLTWEEFKILAERGLA